MLAFAAAVFLLIATPGPGVLSVAGVGAGFGPRAGFRYMAGLFVGTNLVAAAVVGGLAAALLANPALRLALLGISAAYLLWLALRIALAGARIGFAPAGTAPGPLDGILLQLVNPKAYAVNTTLFSGFAFLETAPGLEIALKFLIMNAIWIPLHAGWLGLGIGLRRLALPERMQRRINIGMAAAMVAVVGLALAAQLRA